MEKKMRDLCKEVELWLKRYFPFCLKMLRKFNIELQSQVLV